MAPKKNGRHRCCQAVRSRNRVSNPRSLFLAVVVNLYYKDNATACACDSIGDEHRPYYVGPVKQPLQHKGECAYCHHQECRHRNAVGVAGADGGYCLWQETQYQANACHIAANGV